VRAGCKEISGCLSSHNDIAYKRHELLTYKSVISLEFINQIPYKSEADVNATKIGGQCPK
jgi:hypothetical protein